MNIVASVLIGIVAALHVFFLLLEMFLWQRPFGRRTFGLTEEFAKQSARLAANQGLYNGFLAAGLIWGLVRGAAGFDVKVFFLACVIVAGVYGAISVKRSILFYQAIPGAVALAALLIGGIL
jgi:putative membrane protein